MARVPELTTRSPSATQREAARLTRLVEPSDLVDLSGDLGTDKTLFVKGLTAGLGLDPTRVASPTFTLIQSYTGGRLPLHHIDLYRLTKAAELEELGLHELLFGEGVSAVEWIDRFPELLSEAGLEVRIEIAGATQRRIHIRGVGPRGEALAAAWLRRSRS